MLRVLLNEGRSFLHHLAAERAPLLLVLTLEPCLFLLESLTLLESPPGVLCMSGLLEFGIGVVFPTFHLISWETTGHQLLRAAHPLDFLSLHAMWTPVGSLISYKVMSTISVGCDFTTKSGGI